MFSTLCSKPSLDAPATRGKILYSKHSVYYFSIFSPVRRALWNYLRLCPHDSGRIFDRLKIRAFRCSVHKELPQPYKNLDAQPFKVPCEQRENIERCEQSVRSKISRSKILLVSCERNLRLPYKIARFRKSHLPDQLFLVLCSG